MEYVSGMLTIATTAGPDSAISSHSISVIFLTNNIATYNNAAPSISFGKLVASGEKNKPVSYTHLTLPTNA